MRAVLITAVRRAAPVLSRQVAPRGMTFFQALAARRPVNFSTVFQSNEDVVEEVNKRPDSELYAVDAPDGEHDREDLEEHKMGVENIINYAASHEDAAEINAEHAAGSAKAFAVDAPDGDHDLEDVEEHGQQVKSFINAAASIDNSEEINAEHAAGSANAFAVDAPDGEHDLEDVEEHGQQVKSFIDDAAKIENLDEIKTQQEIRKGTRVEAERHLEHDL